MDSQKKRRLCCLIATALLISSIIPAHAATADDMYLPDNALLGDKASLWARAEIEDSIALGFVPISIREDYQRPITRAEFAKMAVYFLAVQYGYQPEHIIRTYGNAKEDFSLRAFKNAYCAGRTDRNGDPFRNAHEDSDYTYAPNNEFWPSDMPFTDVEYSDGWHYVNLAYHMGIVNGVSAAAFDPKGGITRQEAAAMLSRVYENYGEYPTGSGEQKFSDDARIAGWARKSVYRMAGMDVMRGTGENTFAPLEEYTVEQAILSFLRLYNGAPVGRKHKNVTPLLDPTFERAKYLNWETSGAFFHEMSSMSYSDFELVYGYWTRRHRHEDHKLYLFYKHGGLRDLTSFIPAAQDNEIPIEEIRVSKDEKTIAFIANIPDTFTLHNQVSGTEHVYDMGAYRLEFDVETGDLLGMTKK